MPAIIIQLLTMVAQIAGDLGTAESIASVIATLEQILAAGIQEVESVAPMIKNIIAALQSNSAVTAAQLTALAALDAQVDASFEAAATAAGAAPDPNAAPAASGTSSGS